MGLVIKGDFETERGQAEKIYVRLEQFTFRKLINRIDASFTYWLSSNDTDDNHKSIINSFVLYDNNSEGDEINLPNSIQISTLEKKKELKPIYKIQKVEEKVPYVSFDENGDEITKYRAINVEKKVKVGDEEVEVDVQNINMVQEDVFGTIYDALKVELSKQIDSKNIKTE
tara:strand:+ start:763 stop:1275 length:513 start_codon:yes stop_codon:yes gene_type:complete